MNFFKVTENNWESSDFEELIGKIDSKSNEIVSEILRETKDKILYSILDCESPIEMILALEMHRQDILNLGKLNGLDVVDVIKQERITAGGSKYRVDFLIPVWSKNLGRGAEFVIECNGHEFHEKTKEQVSRDNARQRKLTNAGYVVINFSGSEIYRDPRKCVSEIKDAIWSKFG